MRQFAVGFWSSLTAGNPHRGPVRQLLHEVQSTDLDAPPATYSNAGFELLGAALAAVADTPYEHLLRERVLTPLGMSQTTVPRSGKDLDDRDVRGQTAGGRTAAPWLGPAIAPAGGVRSDLTDMTVLARALLTGGAPGAAALNPRAPFGADRIGWAWLTTTSPGSGRQVVWHNGGTGGFTSFVGVDRDAGHAVVLLSAVGGSPEHVTRAGFELLDRLGGAA